MQRQCPECGRVVETVRRGPFRVECWPQHHWRRVSADYKGMSREEMSHWREDHEEGGSANWTDQCRMSGQPV